MRSMNEMALKSYNSGSDHIVGGTTYKGRLPLYTELSKGFFIKTSKGLPFVRINEKPLPKKLRKKG